GAGSRALRAAARRRGRRAPLHRQRQRAGAAHRARRRRGQRRGRAVARAAGPGHRRHRRDARPADAGARAPAVVRRRPPRRHRRLPDLRLRARGAAAQRRPPARGRARHGGRRGAAAGLELPVLPGRRQDRRPLLPGLPQLLERRGLLRDRPRPARGRDRHRAGGVLGAGLRARGLPLPLAHAHAAAHLAGAHRRLGGHLRAAADPGARPEPRGRRRLARLPGLLRRGEPAAHPAPTARAAPHRRGL
ncbi:MAG: Phosphatidylcholine synthase, partial [uncultured Quadrisphaera sp.]